MYLLTVLTLVLFLYLPNLMNNFVNWDDYEMILKDPILTEFSISNIKNILTAHFSFKYCRIVPLAYISYAFDHHFFGHNPYIYHLTQTLFHLLNVCLVFLFTRLLLKNAHISFITSLLFALHPINVEPVAWISARAHVLFVFFYLISLISYLFSENNQNFRLLTLIAFFLSLLSCSFAITLPCVLLLIDYHKAGKIDAQKIIDKIPFFLLSLFFGLLTIWAAKYSAEISDPFLTTKYYSFASRMGLSLTAIYIYLSKFILPISLCGIYPINYYINKNLIFAIFGIMALFLFLKQPGIKESRNTWFCLLFFFITTFPFLHMFGVNETIISERYMYLPSISLFMATALVFHFLINHNNPVLFQLRYFMTGCLIAFVGILLMQSYLRLQVWRNGETFWSDVIAQNPRLTPAYLSRGRYYLTENNPGFASRDFRKAIELDPHNVYAHKNLGHSYLYKGNIEQAQHSYATAILIDPVNPSHYTDRGNAFFLMRKYADALKDYDRALRLDTDHTASRLNRGVLLQQMQEYEKALNDFYHVLTIDPANEMAIDNINKINNLLGI